MKRREKYTRIPVLALAVASIMFLVWRSAAPRKPHNYSYLLLRKSLNFRRILSESDAGTLRNADLEAFPIEFGRDHYSRVLQDPKFNNFSRVAFLNDSVIGGFSCYRGRHGEDPSTKRRRDGNRLFILSFGILPAFQGLSLGKQMFEHIKSMALSDTSTTDILTYQPLQNPAVIGFFYTMGFKGIRVEKDYYMDFPQLQNKGALLLNYKLRTFAYGPPDWENRRTRLLREASVEYEKSRIQKGEDKSNKRLDELSFDELLSRLNISIIESNGTARKVLNADDLKDVDFFSACQIRNGGPAVLENETNNRNTAQIVEEIDGEESQSHQNCINDNHDKSPCPQDVRSGGVDDDDAGENVSSTSSEEEFSSSSESDW